MNILKKQGVAWVITVVMILLAISIGSAREPVTPEPPPASIPTAPGSSDQPFYVYDDANVLSADEEVKLSQLNGEMYAKFGTVVACVTTNYGRDDLYNFAYDYAGNIGLDAYDFIVVLDISGENYWLIQGIGLVDDFTDDDCGDYAWDYMEDHFARGDYGDALVDLSYALYDWYQSYYR